MELTLNQCVELIQSCCQAIIDNVDVLTKADQEIGDGDHGVGMKRGFSAASRALTELADPKDVGTVFKTAGQAIIAESGGASGIIFGLLFRAGAKALPGETLDEHGFVSWLEAALNQIETRGKAKPGDKTMLDALAPAAKAARESVSAGLAACSEAASQASAKGVEETKNMVATFGKAKALGTRSIGFADPGAISCTLILQAAASYISAASC